MAILTVHDNRRRRELAYARRIWFIWWGFEEL